MALLKTPVEKATDAFAAAENRLVGFEAEATALRAKCDATGDFEAGLALREERAAVERKIDAARAALDHATQHLDKVRAVEAEAAVEREHAALEKEARAAAAKCLEVLDHLAKAIPALEFLEAHRARVEDFRAAHPTRPFIADGERRIREIGAHVIPAVTRTERMWCDDSGNRPTFLKQNAAGEMVPADHSGDWRLRDVKVVERAEQHVLARSPERLASAIKIVGKHGEQLWPRR